MREQLFALINELKEKLNLFKEQYEKLYRYKNYKFYQKKVFDYLKDLRAVQLKLRKIERTIKKKDVKANLTNIVSLLDNLISLKVFVKEDVVNNLETLELVIQDLEIDLEEDPSIIYERIYDKGSRFDFHLDIKAILDNSKNDIFIVDSWVNEDLLELYLKNLPKNIKIRVLTGSNPKGKLVKISNMFNSQHGQILEVRESQFVHDRSIFCDIENGWVMGQSIKDGGKKPTYIIKLRDAKKLKDIYELIWQNSKKIV